MLTCPELLSTVEAQLPEHRERHYPPTETLSMFLAQALNADRSCQKAVNDAAIQRVFGGLPTVSTATGGYCRARQRLPLAMVSALVCRTGELMNSQLSAQWRWQGSRVHLIDGTTVRMPDTDHNQATYPQQSGQKPGLGFPICRLVGVICLVSGAVLNAAMGGYKGKGTDNKGCFLAEYSKNPMIPPYPEGFFWLIDTGWLMGDPICSLSLSMPHY